MDLGALFNPQPQVAATPDPNLKSEWDGWLSNPANKAGLLSFGLQAMAGGWGNGTQQLSAALGAGVEGYAGAQKIQQDKDLEERLRNEKRSDSEADRQLRRDLNAEDNSAAMARTKYSVNNRVTSDKEQAYWDRMSAAKARELAAANAKLNDPLNKALNPDAVPLSEAEIMEQAAAYADGMVAKRRGGRGPEAIADEKTSEILPETKGSLPTVPPAQTPASGQREGSESKTPTNTSKPSTPVNRSSAIKMNKKNITPYLSDPRVSNAWKTNPAYRAKMMSQGWMELGE